MDWTRTMPRSQGFSPDMADRLDAMVASGALPAIHAIALSRHGKLVLERYFTGSDQQIAVGDLGTIAFTGERLHDLRSVTKSIVGLLYGIAAGLDWPLAGRLASLLGGLKIACRGGQNHRFTREEIGVRFKESFGIALW